ncbi:hypothetical protein [Enterococcus faecalis]|uniref:hypothetical protein n=1 Tax=Enterococcus faecalis TaxID=1351 RepID=UPI001D0B59E2|nr:hypothetical protein [Enterococcus faecalis]MCB8504031.1 hypothetical protein [Enterococcus faecalis]MCB8514030.1 hypothetical protein [Enterococcus faecalis]
MFDFSKYHEISKKIESEDRLLSDECYRRTAVSRAYYSVYKVCDEKLKSEYNDTYNGFQGKGSHQKVWKLCDMVPDLKKLDISNKAFRLLDKRKLADYDPNKSITKIDVKMANADAQFILNKIKKS